MSYSAVDGTQMQVNQAAPAEPEKVVRPCCCTPQDVPTHRIDKCWFCRRDRTRSCTDREPPELSDCSAFAPNPPSGVLDPLVWLSSLRPGAHRQSSVSFHVMCCSPRAPRAIWAGDIRPGCCHTDVTAIVAPQQSSWGQGSPFCASSDMTASWLWAPPLCAASLQSRFFRCFSRSTRTCHRAGFIQPPVHRQIQAKALVANQIADVAAATSARRGLHADLISGFWQRCRTPHAGTGCGKHRCQGSAPAAAPAAAAGPPWPPVRPHPSPVA